MKAKRNAELVTTPGAIPDNRSERVQRSYPVSPPPSLSLAGRRMRKIVLDRPLDMWVEFVRQQAKKVRVWLDTSCGCSHVTAFVKRQAEKLSIWFDAACTRYGFTHFWRPQAEKLRAWTVAIHRRLSVLSGWWSGLVGKFSLPLLIGWCWFAAALLLVSFVVHVSTFLGIDPIAKWPGVMFTHLAVMLSCIVAASYASRAGGKVPGDQDRVFKSAPRWPRILTGVLFVYALLNFVISIALNEGRNPSERDGKYVLHSHGSVIREISETEFHQHQAYVARAFSGYWTMFSCAALTMFSGALRLRRLSALAPAPTRWEAKGYPYSTTAITEGKRLDCLRNGDRLAR